MNLKIINYHQPNGICGNLLNVIERLDGRKKNELLYFRFYNILYSNHKNVWNKFFYQPFYEYEDLINKKIESNQFKEETFVHNKRYKWNYTFRNNLNILHNKEMIEKLRKIKNKFIFLKKNVVETVKIYEKKYFKQKTLGVHVRGTDKFGTKGHDKFKNKKNLLSLKLHIYKSVDKKIQNSNFTKIFLATDEKKIQTIFSKTYKKKLLPNNSKILSNRQNVGAHFFKIYGNEDTKTNLGIEALTDMLLLSKCNYSLLSQSNLSLGSII
ncbi:nodulation protein NodZ, partial [Candidatus Pelagibacter sp.]|nr:nodulation protein NodZ [Candidatus Pelagibacter sp.]